MDKLYGGIDGCKGGWVFVYGDLKRNINCTVKKSLSEILGLIQLQSIRTAIDMPIGLNRCAVRRCDSKAAEKLGKNGSSVFPMPGSCADEKIELPYFTKGDFRKFKDFNTKHNDRCGRKIPLSTFCIMNKIYEINCECADVVRKLQMEELLFEFHPELFFNNKRNGLSPKKSPTGLNDRCNIIQKYLPNFNYSDLIDEWRKGQCNNVQRDDVVDASAGMILASEYEKSHELSFPNEDISENHLVISIRY